MAATKEHFKAWAKWDLEACRLWREQIRYAEARPDDPDCQKKLPMLREHLTKARKSLARWRRKRQGILEPVEVRIDWKKSGLVFKDDDAKRRFDETVETFLKPFHFKEAEGEPTRRIKEAVNALIIFMLGRGDIKIQIPEVEVWQ